MNKAFIYRLHPTPDQEAILWQWIGAGRWVYNRSLELNTRQYEQDGTFVFAKTPKTGLSASAYPPMEQRASLAQRPA